MVFTFIFFKFLFFIFIDLERMEKGKKHRLVTSCTPPDPWRNESTTVGMCPDGIKPATSLSIGGLNHLSHTGWCYVLVCLFVICLAGLKCKLHEGRNLVCLLYLPLNPLYLELCLLPLWPSWIFVERKNTF